MAAQTGDELIAERLGIRGKVTVAEILALASSGGLTSEETAAVAAGSTLGLQQSLLADAGQPALTVLAVGFTTSGKVQGVSLGDGNVVLTYATGADYLAGNPIGDPEFMSLGEPICFTGLPIGAIITSTQGFYGFCECVYGNAEGPMPLLSLGLSFTFTFFYAFRSCNVYQSNTATTTSSQGWIHIVNGPLESSVTLADGAGVTVQGQENIVIAPWAYLRLYTSGNKEYQIKSTNKVMACHNGAMTNSDLNYGSMLDQRLIMPLTNDGITWPRSGYVSAPYNNTQVEFFTRDGVTGFLNSTAGTGVSPNSPIDFDAAVGVGTGASDADYEPAGATRVMATGFISGYSGADGNGSEASPLMPCSAMSQIVAQPLYIADTADGGNSGVAIASKYVGTAKIYAWDDTTKSLVLKYTVPLNRPTSITVDSAQKQKHPTAGLVANETSDGCVLLDGQLDAGVVIADVPITVVVQNGTASVQPEIRSQGGTTTTSIVNDDDETLTLGHTSELKKMALIEDEDTGLAYRLKLASGVLTAEAA